MEQLILLLSVFVVVWIAVYLRAQNEIQEDFLSLPTRKCTVWFTDDMDACNEGMLHKDTRSIQYLRDNLVGDMEKQIAANNKKIADNLVIINDYRGMQVRAIRDKIRSVSSQIVAREKANLTNRNQTLIDIHQRYLDNLDWYANYYFRTVPQLEAENIRLQNNNTSLSSRINSEKASSNYKNIDASLQVKLKNPNFRCKNEYHGWDEPNSSIKEADNDPVKRTSSTTRGDPYTWASCTKTFPSESDKTNQQNYIENKKFPDIEVDFRDVPGLSEAQNKVTAQIRFQRFSQDERFECDDTVVAPVMPSIPNGLFEVKVDNKDMVQSIRVVRYSNDSRYIDASLTRNIGEVNADRLQELFFDTIYEAWPTQQLYIYPKKGNDIVYRVHYVYYDNKCQRFFPNTTKPLGVSRGGDLMPKEPPLVVYRNDSLNYLFARSIPNKSIPTRYYINHRNPSGLPIFGTIRAGINSEVSNMERLIANTRNSLNYYIWLRNAYWGTYWREPQYHRHCWRWWFWWKCVNVWNWRKGYFLSLAQAYSNTVRDLERYINNNLNPQLNMLYGRRHAFNVYVNELDSAARAFSTNTLQAKLQAYVGRPASELIGGYNPGYLSNNNTLFLQITSYSKATQQIHSMDDAARRISTPEKPLTVYDILDEDTTYEKTFTAEEVDPNNFLYIPEEFVLSDEIKALLRGSYIILYNKENEPIGDYRDLGTFDLSKTNIPEDPVTSIDIAPGIRIEISNGSGVKNTFENSKEATANKRVTLNSTMTKGFCNEQVVDDTQNERSCLLTKMVISKY